MPRAFLLCLLLSLAAVPSAGAEVRILDTATGASRTILRDDPGEPYTEDPNLVRFADDAAVLVRRRDRVLRIGLADGSVRQMPWLDDAEAVGPGGRSIHLRYRDKPRVTLRAADGRRIARYDYWSETGRIVLNDGWRVRILDDPPIAMRTGEDRLIAAAWSLNGSALTFSYSGPLDDCDFPNEGLAALVPGQPRRDLLRPSHRKIVRYAESPDGRFLAVDLKPGEDRQPERRGRRRPWPRTVPRDYGMFTRRGDAAVRRVVLRAASRHRTLIGVRDDFGAVSHPGAGDSAVAEALADAVEQWLHAAGYPGIDALDDVSC